jgi:hypothetical protein
VPTSCVSFKPFVFSEAYLNPQSTTEVVYNDMNWSYALFNQYASGLSYTLRMNYSNYYAVNVNNSVSVKISGITYLFQSWDTITSTYAEANLNALWTGRINSILFNRNFDRTTGKAITSDQLFLASYGGTNNVNLEIIIKSKISYNVNVGSSFLNVIGVKNVNMDNTYIYLDFLNRDDELLQTFLLLNNDTLPVGTFDNSLYNLGTIITGVSQFNLKFQWVDTPPFAAAQSNIVITEFNLFTQNQEINIPDDPTGNLFGFEFVAVEWWNFLGHAQNFLWWIVNKSPISPVFVWIDTYIITWFEGFFNFMEELFNL